MSPIRIADRIIGPGNPCFLVAEIGINHNGSISLAKKTIDAAVEAGADAVKFQNFETCDFLADKNLTYTYQSEGLQITETQSAMFERYELDTERLIELKEYCDSKHVIFFSTPTGLSGIETLKKLKVPLLKNGSDFLTNLELIQLMAKTGLPTVLSTGMASVEEIDDAVNTFRQSGGTDMILLHCTSSYPTPPDEINLRRIPVLKQAFDCIVGFSDHSKGNVAAIGSIPLGACFIEKHFTLDRKLPGPDHWFSSDPKEFKELVEGIRQVESALGSPRFSPTASEVIGRKQFRLSCVASTNLKSGTVLTAKDMTFKRPGTGIPPKMKQVLIGMALKQDVEAGQVLNWTDFHEK